MYNSFIKPLLFLFSPEKAHHVTLFLLKILLSVPVLSSILKSVMQYKSQRLHREVFGLKFENPVGLAAGFDKDGKHFEAMSALGFGFIEIGTVTPKPQTGNPLPRLFRLPEDHAVVNRMGFNNEGVDAMVYRLQRFREKTPSTKLIIGGNIGKNKITPNEEAHNDYLHCFEALYPYVDYFVVNVSSPNTPDLRALQDKEPLHKLLSLLQRKNLEKDNPRPILLKIAPDLNTHQLDDILEIAQSIPLSGIIATNTTIDRKGLQTDNQKIASIGAGGLSGQPLRNHATKIIRYLHQKSEGKLVIIGVGGIENPDDALEKIKAGASLVQVYTGLIYAGPSLVRQINKVLDSQT